MQKSRFRVLLHMRAGLPRIGLGIDVLRGRGPEAGNLHYNRLVTGLGEVSAAGWLGVEALAVDFSGRRG